MWRLSGRLLSASSVGGGVLSGSTLICRERAHHDRHGSVEEAAGEPRASLNADVEPARGEPVWSEHSLGRSSNSASAQQADVKNQQPNTQSATSSSAAPASASTSASSTTEPVPPPPPPPASSSSSTTSSSSSHTRRHPNRHRYTQPGLEYLLVMLSPTNKPATPLGASSPGPVGRVIAQVSESVLAVQFDPRTIAPSSSSPSSSGSAASRGDRMRHPGQVSAAQQRVQVGERVSVLYELNEPLAAPDAGASGASSSSSAESGPSPAPSANAGENASSGVLVDGLVVRLNVDGTVVMLLDTGFLDLAVPRDSLTFLHRRPPTSFASATGPPSFLASAGFDDVIAWLAAVGTLSPEQQLSTACILYHRGWRSDRLYLLERPDVDFLLHLPKPLRLSILEKAEWERDHHRQLRVIYRERVKEKDRRYLFSKYAGILSASVAFIGASSLFGWNYKNYLKQQRSYQMVFAVESLQNTATVARRKKAARAAGQVEPVSDWRTVLATWLPFLHLNRHSSSGGATPGATNASTAAQNTPDAAHTTSKDGESSGGAPSQSAASGSGASGSPSSSGGAAPSSAAAPLISGLASDGKTRMVPRTAEEERLRRLIRRLDCEHPRVPVLTGYYGCGKSSLCRHAMEKEGRAVVFVDVRSKEDMLRGTIKALGVPNVDACGDPLDFISEACHRATASMRHRLLRRRRRPAATSGATTTATATSAASGSADGTAAAAAAGTPSGASASGSVGDSMSNVVGLTRAELNATMPIIVLKLREGDNLRRVYEEAVALACDRRVCHFVIEVPLESLTASNTALPGLDFYMVPNFSREEAFAYTQHRLDPLDLHVFMDTVGTNSNDLDELFAAVHQRQTSPTEYTNQKLLKAIRQLKEACAADPVLSRVVKRLSEVPYDVGMEGRREDSVALHHSALRDIVLYNPVKDIWLFNNEVLHTAAQCCF